jgi:hypothetical protein
MASQRKAPNPFYVLLVLAGSLFLVTALAYGVMTVRLSRPGSGAADSNPALMQLMREKGGSILLAELAVLGVLTVAAIGTDGFWERRAQRKNIQEQT